MANFAEAKPDMRALAFMLAVAPVKIRVGGCLVEGSLAVRTRRGSVAWEKMKAPLLLA